MSFLSTNSCNHHHYIPWISIVSRLHNVIIVVRRSLTSKGLFLRLHQPTFNAGLIEKLMSKTPTRSITNHHHQLPQIESSPLNFANKVKAITPSRLLIKLANYFFLSRSNPKHKHGRLQRKQGRIFHQNKTMKSQVQQPPQNILRQPPSSAASSMSPQNLLRTGMQAGYRNGSVTPPRRSDSPAPSMMGSNSPAAATIRRCTRERLIATIELVEYILENDEDLFDFSSL